MNAMRFVKCLAAAAMLAILPVAAAQADEGTKMDCADLDVKVPISDFQVECTDFSGVVSASSLGRLKAERLTAISEKQGQFIAVWDIRTLGATYIPRGGLEDDVRTFFDEEMGEWKSAAPVADFELAQYVNRRAGGNEEECIAFRRQMQRRSGGGVSGFARMVLGIACTVNARDELLETLKQIEAPGG
jgi:hypothetical protein